MIMGLLNISRKKPVNVREEFNIKSPTGMIKEVVQQGRSDFGAPSVLPVCEHGQMTTCLRRAYSAEVASATKARSRSGRLRAKAGFSGEREGRERRIACSILKGGPFVFNIPIMEIHMCCDCCRNQLSNILFPKI